MPASGVVLFGPTWQHHADFLNYVAALSRDFQEDQSR